jgi:hypothetical protein
MILSAMLAMDGDRTAFSVLPALYGPTISKHIGANGGAPWRINTAQAVQAARFDWSIDIERRQQHAQIGDLTMVYERSRRRYAGSGASARLPRNAAWQANVSYRLASMNGHPLALDAMIGVERRAPLALNGRGRMQEIHARDINLSWYPAAGFTLSGGWQSQGNPARHRAIDRAISIAAGNPVSEAGPRLRLGLDGGTGLLSQPAWHLGLDAGAYRIAARDLAAIGSPDTTDERVTLSLRLALR